MRGLESHPPLTAQERQHLLFVLTGDKGEPPLSDLRDLKRLQLKLSCASTAEYLTRRRADNPRVSQQRLAKELGVSRETLCRWKIVPAPIGGRKASMSAGKIAMEAHAAASHLESARAHLAALMRVVQNATPQEVPDCVCRSRR